MNASDTLKVTVSISGGGASISLQGDNGGNFFNLFTVEQVA